MIRLATFLLGCVLCLQGALAQSPAEQRIDRVALVIGNGGYAHLTPLPNPTNDAKDICAALEALHFEVTCLFDVPDSRKMRDAVRRFSERLDRGAAGLFYYAGHAVQFNGENYLLPTRSEVLSPPDVEFEGFGLRYLISSLIESRNAPNIIILDSCRDNPFRHTQSSLWQTGLARVDPPTGSVIVFSTAPNKAALDGAGRNGLFTKHLLHYLPQQGLTLDEMFRVVARDVEAEAQELYRTDQTPYRISSYSGKFCFNGCENPAQERQMAEIKAQRDALDRRLKDLADENERLRTAADQGASEIRALEQRISALQGEADRSGNTSARIAGQLAEARASLNKLLAVQQERTQLESENQVARQRLQELTSALENRERELADIKSEMDALREEQKKRVQSMAATRSSNTPAAEPKREIIVPSF
ncbi:MAG: caspase family protein [Rhodocyclaceae bacterium]|nr:caspase family protein [Rhodocyclaceae bacterium]